MEQPMKTEYHNRYYLENNINRLLNAAEHRVEYLKIQKEIYDIDAKLKILNLVIEMYPPYESSPQCPNEDTAGC
jgi:hypothetical protein